MSYSVISSNEKKIASLKRSTRLLCYVLAVIAIPIIIFTLLGGFPCDYLGLKSCNPSSSVEDFFNDFFVGYMGVLLAYVGSSLTFYALITSNLDRKIDENPRISDIIIQYRTNIQCRLWNHLQLICITVVISLILNILILNGINRGNWNYIYMFIFGSTFLLNSILTICFWRKCDSLSEECVQIAEELWNHSLQSLDTPHSFPGYLTYSSIQNIRPETYPEILTMMDRIDQLLLAHASSQTERSVTLNIIRDVLRYRFNVLNPLIGICRPNRTERHTVYFSTNIPSTAAGWKDYSDKLYKIYVSLNQMRNILHCAIQRNIDVDPESNAVITYNPKFAEATAKFWTTVIQLFASSCTISSFHYDGMTFQCANFLNSRLQDFTVYGGEFISCIWSRATLTDTYLSMSCHNASDFSQVSLRNSNLSYSQLNACNLHACFAIDSTLDDCLFKNCNLTEFTSESSSFCNSKFNLCDMQAMGFTSCELENLEISSPSMSTMKHSSFIDCTITNWVFSLSPRLDLYSCNFHKSKLTSICFKNVNLQFSNFSHVTAIDFSLKNVDLSRSNLSDSNMPEAQLNGVLLENCDLSNSNFFAAHWTDCKGEGSNFIFCKAQNLSADHCTLQNCNASDVDWSYLKAHHLILSGSRLYNARLQHGSFINCHLDTILGGNLQLTDATCCNTRFSYSDLHNSNLTKSVFQGCDFRYADLSNCSATCTEFLAGNYYYANFNDTIFISFRWAASSRSQLIIENANFTGCQFIKCHFSDLKFVHCNFENCFFEYGEFKNVTFADCIIEEKQFIPEMSSNITIQQVQQQETGSNS